MCRAYPPTSRLIGGEPELRDTEVSKLTGDIVPYNVNTLIASPYSNYYSSMPKKPTQDKTGTVGRGFGAPASVTRHKLSHSTRTRMCFDFL